MAATRRPVAELVDIGPDAGRMLSTYVVEVGLPLATSVDGPAVPAESPGSPAPRRPAIPEAGRHGRRIFLKATRPDNRHPSDGTTTAAPRFGE
jgi:hypothetical protein